MIRRRCASSSPPSPSCSSSPRRWAPPQASRAAGPSGSSSARPRPLRRHRSGGLRAQEPAHLHVHLDEPRLPRPARRRCTPGRSGDAMVGRHAGRTVVRLRNPVAVFCDSGGDGRAERHLRPGARGEGGPRRRPESNRCKRLCSRPDGAPTAYLPAATRWGCAQALPRRRASGSRPLTVSMSTDGVLQRCHLARRSLVSRGRSLLAGQPDAAPCSSALVTAAATLAISAGSAVATRQDSVGPVRQLWDQCLSFR